MQSEHRPSTLAKATNLVLFACVLLAVAAVLWSYTTGGLVAVLFSRSLSAASKVQHLRDFFLSFGTAAPAAYVLMTVVEVVIAPLPGLLLYAPGGVIFGGFWGGFLSLTGNILGAAIACHLMRSVRSSLATLLPPKQSLQPFQERMARHGLWVVFLLRINPLTSSDLVSYATGLTPLPIWKLCIGTALGLAPLCWLQAYAAEGLMQTYPQLLYPLLILCAIYMVLALAILWRTLRTTVSSLATAAATQQKRPPR